MRVSAGHSQSGIDPRILKEAAQWLTRFQTDGFDDRARAEWQHWKGSSAEHAQAWEKAERLLGMIRTVPPELKSTLDRPARLSRRQVIKAAVSAAVVGPTAWVGYQIYEGTIGATYTTDVGQIQTIALDDGLSLSLNTDSAVRMERNEGVHRIHLLRGEMLVDTLRALLTPAASLSVATDDGWLRLRDARVNVRRTTNGTDADVLRGSASLVVASEVAATTLRASQRALFKKGSIINVGAVPDVPSTWVDGLLFADDMRLADFLAEVARYRHGYLICDPAIADLRISGSFQIRDSDRILSTLQHTLPVDVSFKTRFWVSVVPRGKGLLRT